MRIIIFLSLIHCCSIAWLSAQNSNGSDRETLFAAEALKRIQPRPSVRGDDAEWFFLAKELKHLSTGRFWEKPWEEVAANGSDPVPSILEFHELLAKKGISLLLVPVPAKASLYPDKLAAGFSAGEVAAIAPMLERISLAGVRVLDLEPRFLEDRSVDPDRLLYCRQDAHFSPAGAELVAALIADEAKLPAPDASAGLAISDEETISLVGDQIAGSEWEGSVAPESLPIRYVDSAGARGISPDAASSVLLLGDSHTLVFHEGKESGMHCSGAGVIDHLAVRLGVVPDLVGVRGSGLVQARKQLFYKAASTPGYWESKKLVIWLFSVREFTQSTDRFISIPLER